MPRICVATLDSRVYYNIVTKLKKANLRFISLTNDNDLGQCDLIITSKNEANLFAGNVLSIEELDEDPIILKGQIMASILKREEQKLILGVDPGSRIGLAVFYGGLRLAFLVFNSKQELYMALYNLVTKIPNTNCVVRIGNGEPRIASWIASQIKAKIPNVLIELVDESGTSSRSAKGITRDQSAAAKIALRRGRPFVL